MSLTCTRGTSLSACLPPCLSWASVKRCTVSTHLECMCPHLLGSASSALALASRAGGDIGCQPRPRPSVHRVCCCRLLDSCSGRAAVSWPATEDAGAQDAGGPPHTAGDDSVAAPDSDVAAQPPAAGTAAPAADAAAPASLAAQAADAPARHAPPPLTAKAVAPEESATARPTPVKVGDGAAAAHTPPAPGEPVDADAAHAGDGGGRRAAEAAPPGMDTSPVMGLVDERTGVAPVGAPVAAPTAHAPTVADHGANPEPGPAADADASLALGGAADAGASPMVGLTRGAAATPNPAAMATPASAAGAWRALASPAGADAGPAPLVRGLALALGTPMGTPGSGSGGASPEPGALDAIAQVRAPAPLARGRCWISIAELGGPSSTWCTSMLRRVAGHLCG